MNGLRQFLFQMSNMMGRGLYGRNGFDSLARTCYSAALVLMIINLFADNVAIYFIWVILFGYGTFRVFSKNISKRYAENEKFLVMTKGSRSYMNLLRLQVRDRATSRYFVCRHCHQQIRVPKGKGKIEIRCPKCGERFIRRT